VEARRAELAADPSAASMRAAAVRERAAVEGGPARRLRVAMVKRE
jgi:hypothetical protein